MKYIIWLGAFFGILFASVAYAQQPTIITGSVSDREEFSVTLNGEARLTSEFPFGRVFFEYGRTETYGSRTNEENIITSQSFSESVRGLREDRSYHYRAVLIASDGRIFNGSDRTFITTPDNNENPVVPGDNNDTPGTSDDDSGNAPIITADGDLDGDGISNGEECPGIEGGAVCPNSDTDNIPDYLDIDSDGDGIEDQFDSERTNPENNTGTETEGGEVTVGETDPAGPGLGDGGGLIPNNGSGGVQAIPDADYNPDKLVPCDGPDCDFNAFVRLIQNVMRYLIYLTALMLVASIAYAGYKIIVKGNSATAKSEGKNILTTTVVGLLLTMFAFLGVNTVIGIFTDTDVTRQFIDES